MNVALPISFAQLDPGGDQFPNVAFTSSPPTMVDRSTEGRASRQGGPCDIAERQSDDVGIADCDGLCGKQTLTDRSPRMHRTCDACKAIQKRERNRRTDARRKAERHAVKAKMAPP